MSSSSTPTPTPSVDSIPNPASASHSSDANKLENFEQSLEDLNLCEPAPSTKKDQPHVPVETMHYRGSDVKPLSSFGIIVIDYSLSRLPWINDHTSGNVHPDMPTIAMIYNSGPPYELPDTALAFISQSAELLEEARWEKMKAMFYGLYPEIVKGRVFKILQELPALDASTIIANKVSRLAGEVLFRPIQSDTCGENDAVMLQNDLRKRLGELNNTISHQLKTITELENSLQKYTSYTPFENTTKYAQCHDSSFWMTEIKNLHALTKQCGKSRLLHFQLNRAVARFEPRTQWIHISTDFWYSNSVESESVSKLLRELYDPKYVIQDEEKQKNSAMRLQMRLFASTLQSYRQGHFGQFEAYHNDPSLEEFIYRINYSVVSPLLCSSYLELYLDKPPKENYFIASRPVISRFEKRHHEIKVYINTSRVKIPYGKQSKMDESITFAGSNKFCLNCFERDHLRAACTSPKYESFGLVFFEATRRICK